MDANLVLCLPEAMPVATDSSLRLALDRFLRQLERRALKMAELGTRDRQEALDVVQDAMTGFVKSYANKPAEDWGKLFYTVLDSRLQDWHRRQAVRRRFRVWFGLAKSDVDDHDPIAQVPDASQYQPDALLLGSEAGVAIEAALKRLPERQRQAFMLRVWEGFDGAQTAAVMRCSEGSVKTHLSRSLASLRKYLEPLQ